MLQVCTFISSLEKLLMLRLLSTFVRNMIVLPPKNVAFDFQDSGARRNRWFGFLSAFWTKGENRPFHYDKVSTKGATWVPNGPPNFKAIIEW